MKMETISIIHKQFHKAITFQNLCVVAKGICVREPLFFFCFGITVHWGNLVLCESFKKHGFCVRWSLLFFRVVLVLLFLRENLQPSS